MKRSARLASVTLQRASRSVMQESDNSAVWTIKTMTVS